MYGGWGGARTLLMYVDWYGELSVNGGPVMKLDGPCDCQDVRNVAVDLKPGKNEIKVRVRAGSDGRWYLSLGLLRSDRQQTPIGMVGKGESISFRR